MHLRHQPHLLSDLGPVFVKGVQLRFPLLAGGIAEVPAQELSQSVLTSSGPASVRSQSEMLRLMTSQDIFKDSSVEQHG